MTSLEVVIKKFAINGDKTGWTHIVVPQEIAETLYPNNRKSFRVKGFLDDVAVSQMAIQPIKDGGFLLALKGELRRKLRKGPGATLLVRLQKDDAVFTVPESFIEALATDADAQKAWAKLPLSHQRYYVNQIFSAKTTETQLRRMAQSIAALAKDWSFGEMTRAEKESSRGVQKG